MQASDWAQVSATWASAERTAQTLTHPQTDPWLDSRCHCCVIGLKPECPCITFCHLIKLLYNILLENESNARAVLIWLSSAWCVIRLSEFEPTRESQREICSSENGPVGETKWGVKERVRGRSAWVAVPRVHGTTPDLMGLIVLRTNRVLLTCRESSRVTDIVTVLQRGGTSLDNQK